MNNQDSCHGRRTSRRIAAPVFGAVLLSCLLLSPLHTAFARELTFLGITPTNPTVTVGGNEQFYVVGFFDDSSGHLLRPSTAAAADMNGSGTVTTADFGLLRARFGTVPGPSGLHP